MMYIFEGVDHVGKDTLINLLKEKTQIPVFNGLNVYDYTENRDIHPYIFDEQEWQKAISFEIVNLVEQTGIDIIVNRFTWSEIVYSNVLRKGVEPFYSEVMRGRLESVAKIVYIYPPSEEVIFERIKKTGRVKDITREDLMGLLYQYQHLVNSAKCPLLELESDDKLFTEETVDRIIKFWEAK